MEVQKKNMSVVLLVNSLKKAGVSQTLEISCQLQLRDATCSFKAQGSSKMHTKRSGNFSKSFKLLSCEKNEWSELPSSRFLQTKTLFFLRHLWYFKMVSNSYDNFEISLVVFMPNITTNHAITYTNTVGGLGEIIHGFVEIPFKSSRFITLMTSDSSILTVKYLAWTQLVSNKTTKILFRRLA